MPETGNFLRPPRPSQPAGHPPLRGGGKEGVQPPEGFRGLVPKPAKKIPNPVGFCLFGNKFKTKIGRKKNPQN